MRLTRGSDYAMRGMIYLAKQPRGQICLVSDVAEAQGVPESYLAKIFQDLSRSGLVISHRGAKGGFALARDPDRITLRQVIEAVEGPIALSPCLDERVGCELSEVCEVHLVLAEAQAQLLRVLDGAALQDVLNSWEKHVARLQR
ncbi:MAG: Rrf2 family transcriptional regulator [Anaerolineae bacterium]|nr:MAG: Rrf2 family transcriptional regulator [Anaerolineae bacterium]